MSYNSFLGRAEVVRAMLASPKAPFLASGLERRLFRWIGPTAIRLFGWPLALEQRLVARAVLGLLQGQRGKLLDAGGSYGPHAFELARRGWEVTVIDIDQDNLKLGEAIKHTLGADGVSFHYGDITATGIPDGEFDTVLGCEIIEHLKDDQEAVREWSRLLKPGGFLVLATPYSGEAEEHAAPKLALAKPRDDIPEGVFIGGGHWRSGYNEKSMASLLEKNGFGLDAVRYIRLPRMLPQAGALFPLTYPLALLAQPLSRNRVGLVVKARKL